MYERFTDEARKVIVEANRAAKLRFHEFIGTEHVLIGLCKVTIDTGGVIAELFKALGLDPAQVIEATSKVCAAGPETELPSKLPQTQRKKKVI